jgi:hypothetical protein
MIDFKAMTLSLFIALLAIPASSAVVPPTSMGFGQSLGEWQLTYWTATLTQGAGTTAGHVLLLPLPQGDFNDSTGNFEGVLAVELNAGTAFFLPIFVFIGESYVQSVPEDDPADYEGLFLDNPGLSAVITLDGSPLIDSSTDDLADFYAGPVYFDPEITDGYPASRGEDLDAAAAIWVEGLGFAHPPLAPGEHELHLLVDTGLGFGFDNTWHLTVMP